MLPPAREHSFQKSVLLRKSKKKLKNDTFQASLGHLILRKVTTGQDPAPTGQDPAPTGQDPAPNEQAK